MVHNIVIGGSRAQANGELNQLASGLRSSARLSEAGRNSAHVTIATDAESLDDYLKDGETTVLIVSEEMESLETGRDVVFSTGSINQWRTQYPGLLIFLVVDNSKKRSAKLAKLYNAGYYDALYVSDLKTNSVISLICEKGRTAEAAKAYYGVIENSPLITPKMPTLKPQREVAEENEDENEQSQTERPRKKSNPSGYVMAPMNFDEVVEQKPQKRRIRPVEEEYEEDEYKEEYQERPVRDLKTSRRRQAPEYEEDDFYIEEGEEDGYEEDDFYIEEGEEDEYEEDEYEEERPARRSKGNTRPKAPKQKAKHNPSRRAAQNTRLIAYPISSSTTMMRGDIVDIEDGEEKDVTYFTVRVVSNAEFSEDFIDSPVYFFASTDRD